MLLDYIFKIKVNGQVVYVKDGYDDISIHNQTKTESCSENSTEADKEISKCVYSNEE